MTMEVAAWALAPKLGNVGANLRRIEEAVTSTSADYHVFPELFLTGYNLGDDLQRLAVDTVPEAIEGLVDLVQDVGSCLTVGAPISLRTGLTYNAAVTITPRDVTVTPKRYLPNFTTFQEAMFFTPGDEQPLIEVGSTTAGIGICYDLYFPELHADQARSGADLLVNISASPSLSQPNFERLLVARAIENACFVAYSNNVGSQDGLSFWGGSRVLGARGEVLAEVAPFTEGVALASLDEADLRLAREFRPTIRDALEMGFLATANRGED